MCKHGVNCKHIQKCEFKNNEKSDNLVSSQLVELGIAVKEHLKDKVKQEKKFVNLEQNVEKIKAVKTEMSKKSY